MIVIPAVVDVTVPLKLNVSSEPEPSTVIALAFRMPAVNTAPPPFWSTLMSKRLAMSTEVSVIPLSALISSSTGVPESITAAKFTAPPVAVIMFVPVAPVKSIPGTFEFTLNAPLLAVKSTLAPRSTPTVTSSIVNEVPAVTSALMSTAFVLSTSKAPSMVTTPLKIALPAPPPSTVKLRMLLVAPMLLSVTSPPPLTVREVSLAASSTVSKVTVPPVLSIVTVPPATSRSMVPAIVSKSILPELANTVTPAVKSRSPLLVVTNSISLSFVIPTPTLISSAVTFSVEVPPILEALVANVTPLPPPSE